MKSKALPKWRLKKGMDRRFKLGHPWVYSNELAESPKGIEPGQLVELMDPGGEFLAVGFGNPQSLIAFRTVSRDPIPEGVQNQDFFLAQTKYAQELRVQLGLDSYSYRLVYGEADGIPGLIIDRYLTDFGQAFVVQAQTAGADKIMGDILEILERLVDNSKEWKNSAVVVRNDASVRKLEGLAIEESKILKEVSGANLKKSRIFVKPAMTNGQNETQGVPFFVNLIDGQKTGFFLDQVSNIELVASRFSHLRSQNKITILDLCTYVGQWGTQLAYALGGKKVHVTAVDASKDALELAAQNIAAQGALHRELKMDVLKDLNQLEGQSFDLVICDPPAFVKGRKDLPQGTHAYLQLNTQALRLVKKGGGIVSCSCSSLLEETVFFQVLAKASRRNKRTVQWIGRGGPGVDHPQLAEFPEGRYLKCLVGVVR